jgi:transposase
VKRAKNDRNDAEAICEAAGRPGMRFVPVKSAAQQAHGMVLKVRETLVGQRTQLVNTFVGTLQNSAWSPAGDQLYCPIT